MAVNYSWLGYVEQRDEITLLLKIYEGNPSGRRSKGRPRKTWLGNVIGRSERFVNQ